MKGLNLRSLRDELCSVAPQHTENPAQTIENTDEKLGDWLNHAREMYGEEFKFAEHYRYLSLRMLAGFSFDELCKLHHSSTSTMDRSVEDLFFTNPRYEVVRKIRHSMWRWGSWEKNWNNIVDGYNCIRHFSVSQNPDFDVRLDYATRTNERGYSRFSRVYIDGAFGYLVYYKGSHVMTIGFSITGKKEILLQQVQLKERRGNRFLYKLPRNRMEFVLDRFSECFPRYPLYVIDGASLLKRTLDDYRQCARQKQEYLMHWERALTKPDITKSSKADAVCVIKAYKEECAELRERIRHLRADRPRLIEFYRNTGHYMFSAEAPKKPNGLTHFRVEREALRQAA